MSQAHQPNNLCTTAVWAVQEAVVQMERQQATQMRKDAGVQRTRRCRKCRVRICLMINHVHSHSYQIFILRSII